MKLLVTLALILLLISAGCESNGIQAPEERISKMTVTVDGLNSPGDSTSYVAWLYWTDMSQQDQDTVRLGTLEYVSGKEYSVSSNVPLGNLQGGSHVIVTMETNPNKILPSEQYTIISANVYANKGDLLIGHKATLDFDFSAAHGFYMLDTPTEVPASANPTNGIWFLRADSTFLDIEDSTGQVIGVDTSVVKIAGLDLPILPAGWTYEGFVIVGSDTLSTGKFTKPAGADLSKQYSGTGPGFAFPGEDFLTNHPSLPADLRGRKVFVTLSPNHPAGSPVPYMVTAYETTISATAQAKQRYSLENVSNTWPGGKLDTEITLYK